MFISATDLETQIRAENLANIATTAITDTAIEIAIQVVKDHLYLRYDTDALFAQTGSDRHQSLVDACATIALFKLYKRLPARKLPEWLAQEYDETLQFLNLLANGKIGLPATRREQPDSSKIRYSTRNERSL